MLVVSWLNFYLTRGGCYAIILTMGENSISKICEFVIAKKICDAVFDLSTLGDPPTPDEIIDASGLFFNGVMCNPYDSKYIDEWFGLDKWERMTTEFKMDQYMCETLLAKLKLCGRVEEVQSSDGWHSAKGWKPTDEEIERRKKYYE